MQSSSIITMPDWAVEEEQEDQKALWEPFVPLE